MSRISIRGLAVTTAAVVATGGAVAVSAWADEPNTASTARAVAAPTQASASAAEQAAQAKARAQAVAAANRTARIAAANRAARAAAANRTARIAAANRAARLAAAKKAAERAAAKKAAERDRAAAASRSSRSSTREALVFSGSPKDIARRMLAERGWGDAQFSCLERLWQRESGWNVHAQNPSSSAYGIPQALPGSKMASAGGDWRNSAATQIKWGLGYIAGRYGTPCGAWGHSQSNGWY